LAGLVQDVTEQKHGIPAHALFLTTAIPKFWEEGVRVPRRSQDPAIGAHGTTRNPDRPFPGANGPVRGRGSAPQLSPRCFESGGASAGSYAAYHSPVSV